MPERSIEGRTESKDREFADFVATVTESVCEVEFIEPGRREVIGVPYGGSPDKEGAPSPKPIVKTILYDAPA